MARIRGQKKTQEEDDHNAPIPSPRASSINPPSVSESESEPEWWDNFSTRFSGYTPDSLFRVSRKTFEYIRGLVQEEMMTGKIYKDLRREYLALNDCLAIALTRLCTGESFKAIANLFRVTRMTATQITWRFVEAIEKIGFYHLLWPKTEEQFTEIKSKFEVISGLPNCCGAIDTTKIMFSLPLDHAQRKIWCDQENNPCMILQAVVDPDMRFLDIIAGLPGCLSEPDALCEWSLFNLCEEGKRLNGKKLKLAETNEEIGEYIVGNGGFPLLPWLLTPYNEEKKLSDVQEDFNERHYATWKVAKMAFERLKERWQIIQGVLLTPDKLKLPRIIYACCVLHNIMIDQNDAFVMQDESFLQPDDNSPQSHRPKCKFLDKTASIRRDNLARYLSSKPPPFSSNGGIESGSQPASKGTAGKDTAGKGSGSTKPLLISSSSKSGAHSAGSAHVSSSSGLKRKEPITSERPSKTARHAPSGGEGGQEVESPEVVALEGDALHLRRDFLDAEDKGFDWRVQLAKSIADVPPLFPFSREDPMDVLLDYGKEVLARSTFNPDDVIAPEDALTELRHSQFQLSALFSVGMSHLEAARKAVSSHVRSCQDAAPSAAIREEMERLKTTAAKYEEFLRAEKKQKVAAEQRATKAEGELKLEKLLRESDKRKFKESTEQAAREHADALKQVVDTNEELREELDKKDDELSDRIMASYDAAAFHILRMHQLRVPEDQRLTLDEMLEWKNAHIFREDLRVMHPQIPYTQRDIDAFHREQVRAKEELWVPPPVEPRNLLQMVADYDEQRQKELEAAESPLDDMPLDTEVEFEAGTDNDVLVTLSGHSQKDGPSDAAP